MRASRHRRQATVIPLGLLIVFVGSLVLLESSLRLYRWRLAPLRLRVLYATFLLNDEAFSAVAEIHQRAERAAASSFDELFELYAAASGRPSVDIEALFGFRMSWRRLISSRLILRNHLRWHVGLVPIPRQRLRTATITDAGTRSTGAAGSITGRHASSTVKHVVITGGSAAYGYGATSDEATIAGRLQEQLNQRDPRTGHRWEVVNRAFPGATSFQELIVVLQDCDMTTPPAYVVSISGWNDVDQQFGHAEANISALAQGYTASLDRRTLWKEPARAMARRLVLLSVLRRLVIAYRAWPGPHTAHGRRADGSGAVGNQIDRPDIYPLW